MNPLIQLKVTRLLLIILTLLCIGLLPGAQAVVPPPDGGYPNFTTAEGTKALQNLTTGAGNTGLGWFSLFSDTTGSSNTGVGAATLVLNTGDSNTATGTGALFLNTAGFQNTAHGAFALLHNDSGSDNTAIGFQALSQNISGANNTATGVNALGSNTTGSGNTANGLGALIFNTQGGSNTAVGVGALLHNTTNSDNTAVGALALGNNTGSANTAVGSGALTANTGAIQNTAVGFQALTNTTVGFNNTAIGTVALLGNGTGQNNTAIGAGALASNTAGSSNTAIGLNAGSSATTGDNNVYIGKDLFGLAGESNACYIASIFNQVSSSGVQVLINASNKLGTSASSKRFKEDIKAMDDASEGLYALKPVTFRYKKQIDPAGAGQFGLVAEDVEKVNPDLIVRDKEGNPYSVRYDQVNAMLLNEFLKEHRTVLEQKAIVEQLKSNAAKQETTISELRKDVGVLASQLKEQAAQIQKVNARIEANELRPQLVSNGQ